MCNDAKNQYDKEEIEKKLDQIIKNSRERKRALKKILEKLKKTEGQDGYPEPYELA